MRTPGFRPHKCPRLKVIPKKKTSTGGVVKRRSRVLRRRTRQAALDKPRVNDGQLGFAILEQKACVTAENRAFEEKQPLFFLPKAAIMVV